MSDSTSIEWTEASWSPLRARRLDGQPNKGGGGWSCQRVSPGCEHCYAETINKRLGTGFSYDANGVAASEHYLDEKALLQPLHWKRGRRIFLSSMTDVFGEWVTDEQLDRIFAVMALTPQHTFQVLTKRAERMREYLTRTYPVAPGITEECSRRRVFELVMRDPISREYRLQHGVDSIPFPGWPLPNVWLGVSAEDQQRWDERVPLVLATPAAVRFVSYEPALGPIDGSVSMGCEICTKPLPCDCGYHEEPGLDWVIIGGESGPDARPFDIAWARSMVQQCQAAGVAVFLKQVGAKPYHVCGGPTDGHACRPEGQFPIRLKSRKGGDMAEWPADLRVREFPREAHSPAASIYPEGWALGPGERR